MRAREPGLAHDASCICRAHPLPAALGVREARDAYLAENGFTTEAYVASTSKGSLFGIPISVPNPPAHQRAIRLHDLHHVATGYGTDHAGEAEISAWQVRRGVRNAGAYVTAIVLANAGLGLLVAPARTLGAFQVARGGGSLFDIERDYERLLDLTVGELRTLLGVPQQGLTASPRQLHAHAPNR